MVAGGHAEQDLGPLLGAAERCRRQLGLADAARAARERIWRTVASREPASMLSADPSRRRSAVA
ncbi:hypothetical protein [Streptomyces europaeiscabiei]|uniref:hypothetical protein n=1 Tax=Streptomyces europaeiscabiei TaxID=146819 RepID=UPI0029A3BE93|nr:hypothetical protein [Streptomyces europaeiscabiei]MDX2527249.1 hypothetical protein [Streptomyces europaeiscabiei]MDX3667409.1 hypothetical protein [Streptomyces europaeiscabiei]